MKKFIRLLFSFVLGVVMLVLMASCNSADAYIPSKDISVVLSNGKHYTVLGDNSRKAESGGTVTFDVELERGYKVVGAFGDECSFTDEISFKQTVTFSNVRYNMTAQLETEALDVFEFDTRCDNSMGVVDTDSALGSVTDNEYYKGDIISVSAVPKNGYGFVCWSSGNYIGKGGDFYDYEPVLELSDPSELGTLFANFKDITNTKNILTYRMDNGVQIEQDCFVQMEHHYRANTMTAQDMRGKGIDCESRMLVGWRTENDDVIGLGSRIATADSEIALYPVWKDYAAQALFTIENGKITSFSGAPDADGSVVIPNRIGSEKVTAIGSKVFENCAAKVFYVPDTVVTVEDDAFANCVDLKEFYMSDNIMNISDNAFKGCSNLQTLHINAYLKPRFSADEVSVVSENYERLALNADSGKRKVVVLGGSGTQAGYNCSVIESGFKEIGQDVDAYNFGWSAAYCGLAQFEVINHYLRANDVFLHAPEQYYGALCGNLAVSPLTGEQCIALTDGIPYIFRLSELNWDFITHLTVNKYANVFSMFSVFNRLRTESWVAPHEYSDYCKNTVEEGFGYHTNNEQVLHENGEDKPLGGAGDILSFVSHFEYTKKYIYEKITDGVNAYVMFPAVNRASLLATYGSEEKVKEVSDEYTARVKDLLKGLDLRVLLTQYDVVYDGRYFFNHDYHLGHPTRDAHTQKVISALIDDLLGQGGGGYSF